MYQNDPDASITWVNRPQPAPLPPALADALRECVEAGRGHPPAPRGCVSDVVPPVDLARVAEWLGGGAHG
jgi:hypothetical protein